MLNVLIIIAACELGSGGRLYVLTTAYDVDILTGVGTGNTVAPPGGSLLVFQGFPRGQCRRKPCL